MTDPLASNAATWRTADRLVSRGSRPYEALIRGIDCLVEDGIWTAERIVGTVREQREAGQL